MRLELIRNIRADKVFSAGCSHIEHLNRCIGGSWSCVPRVEERWSTCMKRSQRPSPNLQEQRSLELENL